MSPRLDKSREYGTIHPPYHGAMFEQDRCYFSGDERFLFRQGEEAVAVAVPVSASGPQNKPQEPATAPEVAKQAEGVDLAAWVSGAKKYPFFTVKKAVGEAYPDIDLSNAKSIKEGLVAAGVKG